MITPAEQVDLIHSFLRRVHQPGSLIEIRGLGSTEHGTLRLLTDDFSLASRAALKMSNMGADVYYTLNPVNPGSRYAQRTTINYPYRYVRGTAGDADMLRRDNYLIDIDPVRPSGTAATEEHRAAAKRTAQKVKDFLADQGWGDPLAILDSGNGVHLLYRGNGCAPDGDILKFALKTLATRFNDTCKIDTVVHNASRIARLPYTLNSKASRMATVLSYPDGQPVMPWKIYHLALEGGYKSPWDKPSRSSNASTCTLVIDEAGVHQLIAEYPSILHLDRVTEDGDNIFFSFETCPFKGAAHRSRSVGARKTAIILRPDSIRFKCFSDDCGDYSFVDLLHLLHEQTGHWPSVPIWEDDLEELEARWPEGIDDVASEPDPVED